LKKSISLSKDHSKENNYSLVLQPQKTSVSKLKVKKV